MLAAQLLELLDTCSADLQRDIIKFLPEIVTDEHHAVRPCPISLFVIPGCKGRLQRCHKGCLV